MEIRKGIEQTNSLIHAAMGVGAFFAAAGTWALARMKGARAQRSQISLTLNHVVQQLKEVKTGQETARQEQAKNTWLTLESLNASGYANFQTDEQGATIWVSEGYTDLTRLSLAQARGNGWIGVVDPADQQRVIEEWSDSVRQSRPMTTRYRIRVGGKRVWVEATTGPMRCAMGKVIGFFGRLKATEDQTAT